MTRIITDITDLSAERLTDVLRTNGVLDADSRVTSIRAESHENFFSRVYTLYPIYKPPRKEAPASLFLKIAPAAFAHDGAGRAEVAFYKLLPNDLPVPRCYEAVFDEGTEQFHLLLSDLKRSHQSLNRSLPPQFENMKGAVRALAGIHARWWGAPPDITPHKDPPDFTFGTAKVYNDFATQFDQVLFTPDQRAIYQRVLDQANQLMARAEALPQTLTHGDAHFWNMLFPQGEGDQVMIVDWDTWTIAPGPFDIAYMLSLFLSGDVRPRVERQLVEEYTRTLEAAGVGGITFEGIWDAYRLGVVRMLFMPIWWWKTDHAARIWWVRFQRVLSAYVALNCDDVLT